MATLVNIASRTPEEVFEQAREREQGLSRLLVLYITTGLFFMLLPGTFLGVWNLISISTRAAADSVSPAWIQAHGHAQVFGWIGSFILGIGFYSLPKLRRMEPFSLWAARACWGLWTAGVALRWAVGVYAWHWRLLTPLSATLELMAFVIFFYCVSGHKVEDKTGARAAMPLWAKIVISATVGLMLTLLASLAESIAIGIYGEAPAFPHTFDQRFLILACWGTLVPFVWGFSAKWLPIFLGLKPTRDKLLAAAVLLNGLGVLAAMFGKIHLAAVLLLHGAIFAPSALRIFAGSERPAKTGGVHPSYTWFVRSAYVWLRIAATLGVWASVNNSPGVWGASRHALTVGFMAMMVFGVGQRVLPAFSGMKLLFSPRLMLASLSLLSIGCLLRVTCEILAYQGYAAWAWQVLPVSAVIELSAVTIFALNLVLTFRRKPAAQMLSPATAPAM
ncbi:MAG TPA: NnrS family protein [Terriglobales bacterium]|nr:NnrS family protein [Terriglobales bacterium]